MSRAILACALVVITAGIAPPTLAEKATPAQSSRRRSQPKPSRRARITSQMIAEAQRRLLDLGYWIGGADGKWGETSRHGLIAFQKVERRARTGKLTLSELQALRGASRPVPRERGVAHVEVDLRRQVLFMVEADGTVSRILPVSSGNGKPFEIEGEMDVAVTPVGRFKVYRKLPGWRKSPLGLLYFPSYIVGGIAIHGNPSVPAQPASHGCIRIPMFASEEFSDLTPVGTQVIVYDGSTP
jgi:peptidoglycan hydrolase-like protein with peptidoglycan-binding domain